MKRSDRVRKQKRGGRLPILGLAALFLLFGLAGIGVLAVLGIQSKLDETQAKFGAIGAGLTFSDRLYYSYELLSNQGSLLVPLNPQGAKINFTIDQGDSPTAVAGKLQSAGLIADQAAFRNYLIYSGLDSHLQAGDYKLSPASSAIEIALKISDANQTTVKFGFLAGMRAEEIAELLSKSGLAVDPVQFVMWVHAPTAELIPPGLNGITSLEGFLYPDVYELDRSTDTAALIKIMLANFEAHVPANIKGAYAVKGLTLQQAVTLASMVQKEAVVEEEQPLIASVFLNRVSAGMKFESDPTVQYALGYDAESATWWKNPLTYADLEVNSPFNTYVSAGFPPEPISNPGLPALKAVAFPTESPYYYFRARCDGSGRHTFSNSLDEHIQNACP